MRVQPNGPATPSDLVAIPYFANANRGPVQMKTWIPRSATKKEP